MTPRKLVESTPDSPSSLDANAENSNGPAATTTPVHRGSQSSTEAPQYSRDGLQQLGIGKRELGFYHADKWHRNVQVCTKDEAGARVPLYYITVSRLLPNRPDILLHRGADAASPIVGAARFRWSRTLHLCIGDPSSLEAKWEDLSNQSKMLRFDKYELKTTNPSRHLVWERTRKGEDGVKGVHKASLLNYRLVDQATGETLAVYLGNGVKSWQKMGKLVISGPMDQELELWAVLGCTGLCEKARRRR